MLFVLGLICTIGWAQAEVGGQKLSGREVTGQSPMDFERSQLLKDSLKLSIPPIPPSLSNSQTEGVVNAKGFKEQSAQGGTFFRLWDGAYVGFYGSNYHLPGLMNTSSGSMMFHQDWGRWEFSASAMANKYWMPWQQRLSTQYGFGGTVGYHVSQMLSLHAFGYYYANQMQVGPSMSPYVNTTTYGGYADVRFSNTFGSKLGVQRYLNPMNGRWETEPIVNPYIKIGNGKLEFPLGNLLKRMVWGEPENPMHFRQGAAPARPATQSPRPVVRRP